MAGYVKNLWNALLGRNVNQPTYLPLSQNAKLDAYRWYYENDALYDRLTEALRGSTGAPILKGIRGVENPVHQVVEFYAAKLLPSDLDEALVATDRVKKCLADVDKWSNWGQRLRVASRWDPMYGNVFLKTASSDDRKRVYRQLIDPRHVTYFEKDERDYFIYLRIDTPQERRNDDGEVELYTFTEVYNKESRTYRAWEHDEGNEAEIEDIRKKGKRVEFQVLSEELPPQNEDGTRSRYTGFDFIPVVHIKFRDVGNAWGVAAFAHCIEAVDSLNLAVTKLDKMLFPKRHLALRANAVTVDGRPMDAPQVNTAAPEDSGEIETVEVEGTLFWRLPGNSTLESVVPSIDFGSHLAAIDQKIARLEKLLPELAYYRLREMSQVTGPAARMLLGDIFDRVEEARENFLAGLIRSNEMALHIGKVLKIEGFADLGTYENGDFEHSFEEREVFPVSEKEKAEEEKAEQDATFALLDRGLIDEAEARKRLGIEEGVGQGAPLAPVAEGVATERQRALMEQLGVTGGQSLNEDGGRVG